MSSASSPAPAPSSAASPWHRLRTRCGTGGLALLALVLAIAIACAVYLMRGETPWESGVIDKIRAEESLTIGDTISAGLWLGAALNLVLALALLAVARWWTRALESAAPTIPKTARGAALGGRLFWILTLLAVLAAGWLRAPRLDHSLWNDEEQAFRKFTWGEYEIPELPKQTKRAKAQAKNAGPDELVFDPADWDRALFYSVNGNNHVVHTVAARLCHAAWRHFAKPDPETFRESVIRLEPFLSGLLAILVLAFWLKIAGFPLAGAASAWIVALHPWLLRYGAEARGYAAMLLFILLAFLCLTLALRTRRWRWWLGYGLAQCLYLLCFAGAVYLAVAMNAVAIGLLAWRRDVGSLWRWFVSCVLGAMLFLQMMTATVLRIWNWIQAPHVEPFPMDAAFFRDFWGHLAIGAPWNAAFPDLQHGVDVTHLAESLPAWGGAFTIGLPILLGLGLVVACGKSPAARLLFGTLALAAALIWAHNAKSELAFYGWYALYFALGFAVALGFVPELVARLTRRKKATATPVAGLVTTLAVVVFYGWLGHASLQAQRLHDRHPMRQAVVEVRGEAPAIAPSHADLLTGAAGSGANQLRTYDPRVRWVKTTADLDALVAEARADGKPLALYLCGPEQLAGSNPELAQRLADRSRFEEGAYLPGIEEFWSFRILRLRDDNAAPER